MSNTDSTLSVAKVINFTKIGQKYPTPSPGSGDRVFYQSLLEEKPNCEMAIIWCIENGVFLEPEHNKLYKKYEAIKAGKSRSEATQRESTTSSASSRRTGTGKVLDDKVDAGMSTGGTEYVGASTM